MEVAASHTGVGPEQSALERQPTHWCEPLQTGVAPEQSGALRQETQALATGSQRGVPPRPQSASRRQPTQAPVFEPVRTHTAAAGSAAQSRFEAHGLQTWVCGSHTGLEPAHCESSSQPTQVPVGRSQ